MCLCYIYICINLDSLRKNMQYIIFFKFEKKIYWGESRC